MHYAMMTICLLASAPMLISALGPVAPDDGKKCADGDGQCAKKEGEGRLL